jgi:hypothetical protein
MKRCIVELVDDHGPSYYGPFKDVQEATKYVLEKLKDFEVRVWTSPRDPDYILIMVKHGFPPIWHLPPSRKDQEKPPGFEEVGYIHELTKKFDDPEWTIREWKMRREREHKQEQEYRLGHA